MKKKLQINTVVLLVVTTIILYVVLKKDLPAIINSFRQINILYILIALIFYFLSIIIKGYIDYIIVNKKEKVSCLESIKHAYITQFFNGITPFSTGGQPMEIYMLTKHDIPVAKATSYTIQSFLFYQIALVIYGVFAVTFNLIFKIFPKVQLLEYLVLLGFIINLIVITFLFLISYSKKTLTYLTKISKKIVRKLKIKKKEETIENKFNEYYEVFQTIKNNKVLFLKGVLLNLIQLFCTYIIPLWIIMSIGIKINAINTIVTSAYVYLIGAFVPIPGASGGIEYGFTQFYGNFVNIEHISALLLIWRFITYYLGIIIGALLFVFEKRSAK